MDERDKEFQHLLQELWDCVAGSPLSTEDKTKAIEVTLGVWKFKQGAFEYIVQKEAQDE